MLIQKSEPDLKSAAEKLARSFKRRPKLAIILGTGFHHLANELRVEAVIPYHKIPGFPRPTVSGHAGQVLLTELSGTSLIVLDGRAHYYEGIPIGSVTFPVRVLAACGISDLLLTNAAGGINPRLRAGDFMILSDHINLMGINPLRGVSSQYPPFVDLSCAYDKRLCRLLRRAGQSAGLRLRPGVYLAVSGPSYETPAEIRAFRRLGADAVGMSTVPEVITARQCGLRVAALSCITNLAAGLSTTPLSHREVLATAARVKESTAKLIEYFVRIYAE